jgi:hypothetical protein
MFGDGWWAELQYVRGGDMGGISNVWWREKIKPYLQGPNVWDGKDSLVLDIKLNTKMVKV